MSYPLDLFLKWISLKNLSKEYTRRLGYCFMEFNTNYGTLVQEAVNDYLYKHNSHSTPKAFIRLLKEFLLDNQEELQLTPQDITRIYNVKVPRISGRKKQRLIVPLTKSELEMLENALETEELKLMMLIAYYGGLRLNELMTIKISSFDWNKVKENPGEMAEVKVYGKGNKEGIALLPYDLIVRLGRFIRSKAFKNGYDSKLFDYTGRFFEIKLKEAGIRSGITRVSPEGEYIKESITNPHRLRHSRAYHLLKQGVDIRYIKEALRHSSISSTQIYTQLSKDDLKEKLRDLT